MIRLRKIENAAFDDLLVIKNEKDTKVLYLQQKIDD
jgi:hypothetical protein